MMSSSWATRRKAALAASAADAWSGAYRVMVKRVPISGCENSKRWSGEGPGGGKWQAVRRRGRVRSTRRWKFQNPNPKFQKTFKWRNLESEGGEGGEIEDEAEAEGGEAEAELHEGGEAGRPLLHRRGAMDAEDEEEEEEERGVAKRAGLIGRPCWSKEWARTLTLWR